MITRQDALTLIRRRYATRQALNEHIERDTNDHTHLAARIEALTEQIAQLEQRISENTENTEPEEDK